MADKRRENEQAKVADRLEPNGTWLDVRASPSRHADEQPPADRPAPNPSVGQSAERGKPVILPQGTVNRKANQWDGGQKRTEKVRRKTA